MPLKRTDRVCLVLGDPLREDGGHDQDDCHAQHVAGVGVKVDDLNVVIVAIPETKSNYNFFD